MSTATAPKPTNAKKNAGNPPELKVGPFQGGVGVNVWLNEVETENGTVTMRSVTIAPRRYLDKRTGEWKDSKSFRPGDLTALILALEKAREHCLLRPLPGETSEDDRMASPPANNDEPPY